MSADVWVFANLSHGEDASDTQVTVLVLARTTNWMEPLPCQDLFGLQYGCSPHVIRYTTGRIMHLVQPFIMHWAPQVRFDLMQAVDSAQMSANLP